MKSTERVVSSVELDGTSEDSCEIFVSNVEVVERLKRELPEVTPLVTLFKMLGDESRCRMLMALDRAEELCVCDLSVISGLTMPTVSHHLGKLKKLELVRSRREGKLVFYRLVSEHVRLLLRLAAMRAEVVS